MPIEDMRDPKRALQLYRWYCDNSGKFELHMSVTVASELMNATAVSL